MPVPKATPALAGCLSALFAAVCLQAQPASENPPTPPGSGQDTDAPASAPGLTATQQLVAPIALYPDPLIALILPASTVPADLSAAQAYLVQYGDMTRIDNQEWDPSVRGLAHYPGVLTWMADNPEWTQALGAAFLASPPEVMDAIQQLRARAWAAGTLVSTAQDQVYSDKGMIEILPAQPDALYVPAYDPDAVYMADPGDVFGGEGINYGPAYAAGPWLSLCLDWNSGAVWVGGWSAWHGQGGWYRPRFNPGHGPGDSKPWHPRAGTVTPVPSVRAAGPALVPHPRPIQGTPGDPSHSTERLDPKSPLRPATNGDRPVPVASQFHAPESTPQRSAAAPVRTPAVAPAVRTAPASPPAAVHESPPSTSNPTDPKNH